MSQCAIPRAVGVILVVLLLLLPACGPFGATPDAPSVATAVASTPTQDTALANATPTLAPTALPSPTPAPEPLTLWTTEREGALDLVRALATEFGAQAYVQVEVVAKSANGLRADMLAAGLAGEATPDLVWGNQEDLAGLLTDGQLQPVGFSVETESFIPALVTNARYEDKLWGQPLTARDALLLLYNRVLVPEPPRTTDELIVQSRAVQGPERYGIVAAWSEARWLLAWLNGFGGAPTTPDGAQPTLDTPEMVRALNLLRELRVAAPSDQRSYVEGSALFVAGQATFAIDGEWALPNYRESGSALDLGVAPMPRVPATDRLAAPALGGAYLMFRGTLTGSALEQAHALARFLTNSDVQVRIAREMRRLPALRAALADPVVTDDPALAAAAAQSEAASGLPPTRALRCAIRAIDTQLPVFLDGQTAVEQIANAMQVSAEVCMAQ